MKIIVNGEQKYIQEDTTVAELMKLLALEGKVMAAAVNMEIVKQDSWDVHKLKDGDELELLDFVGGG